ncbi:helix-turn-helix domain-containing protein [Streptomyces sp. MP131-18]|uniref:ArsR/SmtB family transcription factor n=1 Tax=Streptomyces sp. MP131-18 TaxID=1857892 RepID=UPI00097C144E|nr:helix-turn-helix domain-containing protein [Streptomyces sp. MP131-18]ONK13421.1 Helix-turn-helix domain protein [Streptomyces sp. MP131-18]
MPFTPSLSGLKALAHPRRLQIMEQLAHHGPATSARLARALGLNTGATSYHLRALAGHGFVEETAGTGHGRERWWRAVSQDLRLPPRSRQDAETRAVVDEMNRLAYASDLRLFEERQRTDAVGDAEDADWQDAAFPYSRGTIRVTPAELRDFFEEYIALVNRYKRAHEDAPPDSRTVLTRFLAFPAS